MTNFTFLSSAQKPRCFDSSGLAFSVDKLDGLDDGLKPLYVADGDKFRLNVSGLPKQEDTKGLKTALVTERAAVEKAKKEIGKWKALGLSFEDISAVIEADKTAQAQVAKDSGDFDALMAQAKEKWDKERKDLQDQVDQAQTNEREAIIENQLTGSLAKAGFTEQGLTLLPEILAKRIKIETVDGKRQTTILTDDLSSPMLGEDGVARATFAELAKITATQFPQLVNSGGTSGGGTPPGTGGSGSGKQILRSEWNKLPPDQQRDVATSDVQIVD